MDNTAGSLTQLQKAVVVGSMLGDGYVRKMKGRKNAFLEINHSFKQKEYVDWKYSVLENLTKSKPKMRLGKANRVAYRFYTKQLPELTEIMNKFYAGNKKIIPKIRLDPITLAVWYMDDGSRCRQSDVYLNTQQFDVDDQNKLLRLLKSVGLEATLNKDKEYYRIRFLKSSIPRLYKLIGEYIIPSMKYKIGL
jgi:LAGLIDADG DNA endonuclease family